MSDFSIHAELLAQARQTTFRTIKERARAYILQPWQLDMLGYDAVQFTPEQLIEFGIRLLLRAPLDFSRIDFVPVQKINAKAAILVGRYLRRFGLPNHRQPQAPGVIGTR